ncbi:hypothetical protein BDA99DRAFT_545074 [Phascolomyces articulosus]|uniref:Homeobox domain-containing protein n=1 Tax=Phascolomyces articulosus TaxID=60185 RepID=A0AAD5KP91_9FUNG|nr:hypothetical protein BDA99DRAFT_545074 [Phascolomyces articulosus]
MTSMENTHTSTVEKDSTTVQNKTSSTTTKKRTRATAEQLTVLEDTFAVNVSPNSKLRKQLAERLQMSERSIQIWFQNRRAKVKHMQKRAQMQMQQASIRAQLYHYHQQHYHHHPYHHPQQQPLMPLQPHQQQYYRPAQQQQHQQQQLTYPPSSVAAQITLPRAQSVDTLHPHHPSVQHALSSTTTPPPPSYYPPTQQAQWPTTTAMDEMSPNTTSAPLHPTTPYNNSTIPTLVPVPDAGPTAMLTTSDFNYGGPSTPAATPPAPSTVTNDLWALSDPIVTTIDPSSLMMTPPATTANDNNSNNNNTSHTHDTSLNATTLTIGSWHRLKLRANDLLCVYQPDRRMFAWHIADSGSLFRMEISLEAVASIEYMAGECDVLADVHFDISESPQFYMQQQPSTTAKEESENKKNHKKKNETTEEEEEDAWIQCSDFTEGKQASRFFRHSLKGVAHHMKQELLNLMDKHEETRRLVRFIETPIPTALTAAYQPPMMEETTERSNRLIEHEVSEIKSMEEVIRSTGQESLVSF